MKSSYNRFKGLTSIIVPVFASYAMVACTPDHDTNKTDLLQSRINITFPERILAAKLPATGTYSASVSSNCVAGGTPQALTDDGFGSFTGTFDGIPVNTNCTFVIRFAFQDPDFGLIELVTASRQIIIEEGPKSLTYTQGDYIETDTDSDGVSNIAELDDTNRTNPETSPQWGIASWGEEKWTAK